jgi:hypothetical protein
MLPSGAAGQPPSASDEEGVKKLRVNVVRIDVRFSSSQTQKTGFGFIVGAEGGQLIIVTANHVVRSNDPDAGESNVTVTFFGGASRQGALLPRHHDAPYDLAILEVAIPLNFRWVAESIAPSTEIVRNREVWFIGRGGDWYIPSRGSARINDGPDPRSIIQVDTTAVLPGTSGAPLLTENGIIGMIVTDTQGVLAKALAIDFIRQTFDRWGYTWSARRSGEITPPITRYGTLAISGEPAGIEVWLDGKKVGETRVATSLTLDVVTGKHQVRGVREGRVTWEREVEIAANRRAEVAIGLLHSPPHFCQDLDEVIAQARNDFEGWRTGVGVNESYRARVDVSGAGKSRIRKGIIFVSEPALGSPHYFAFLSEGRAHWEGFRDIVSGCLSGQRVVQSGDEKWEFGKAYRWKTANGVAVLLSMGDEGGVALQVGKER